MLSRRDLLKLSLASVFTPAIAKSYKVADPQSSINVTILSRTDTAYSEHRTPFNKRITLQPKFIAVCNNEIGIQEALLFSKRNSLKVSIKGGGHSFEGFSLNDNGLVIDLSNLQTLQLEENGSLTVGAGIKLKQIYEYLLPKGLLLPAGSCGGVGISGLTLGGGYGLFTRKHGLTCDHLESIKFIDGKANYHAIGNKQDDYLWASKGGGNGNFYAASEFNYRLQKSPENLYAYRFKFYNLDLQKTLSLAEKWFKESKKLPPTCFSAFVLNHKRLFILITDTTEPSEELKDIINQLTLIADKVSAPSVKPIEKAVTTYYGRPLPLYFHNISGGFYTDFDSTKKLLAESFVEILKNPGMLFQINTVGGEMNNPKHISGSAFPHRTFDYLGEIQCYWDKDSQTSHFSDLIKKLTLTIEENQINAHYRNYPNLFLKNWESDYYGSPSNRSRLKAVKHKLDPDNLICHPQSLV